VFVVWGKQVTVVEGPKLGHVFDNDTRWSVDQLDAQLSPHFANNEDDVNRFFAVLDRFAAA